MSLIAQKKRPDTLNATQKNHYFLQCMVSKMRFFLIFSETLLCKELVFFALHSVQQDASFELLKTFFGIFLIFFIKRRDPSDLAGALNLPAQ